MSSFVAELKTKLDQNDWTAVVAALRNEPVVWKKLTSEDFGTQALDLSEGIPAKLSPGFLALLSISEQQNFKSLLEEPLQPVGESLRFRQQIHRIDAQRNPLPDQPARKGLCEIASENRNGPRVGRIEKILESHRNGHNRDRAVHFRTALAEYFNLLMQKGGHVQSSLSTT